MGYIHRMKALLVENIHPKAKELLESEGFEVQTLKHAPSSDELLKLLPGLDFVGIRSKTKLTAQVLESAKSLKAIGCFCIGTDQVDLEKAKLLGIPVFNSPYSNTRSVAELVISHMIALSRKTYDRSAQMHAGHWNKSAEGCNEVRGKTLGIVGYGHIGTQVSILAESLGLKVIFFDIIKKLPLGNARATSDLESLLAESDIVTLHVPDTPETKNLITQRQLKLMKKGSHLLNLSRGAVVDLKALSEAIKSEHLAGCALDVYPSEPASNKETFEAPVRGLPNTILTPHIGGSTEEAQVAIGFEVSENVLQYFKTGDTQQSVNFPKLSLPLTPSAKRILHVHLNQPGVLGEVNGVMSKHKVNILAQALMTDPEMGYLIMDIEAKDADLVISEIRQLQRTLRAEILN